MSPLSNDPARRARQLANLDRRRGHLGPGNQAAATHKGYARVARGRLDAKVLELVDALGEDLPMQSDGDAAMVRLLAEVLCRIDSVGEWVTLNGILGPDGEPRTSVLDLERKLRSEASDYLDSLGMTPRSRAKLGVDMVHATLDAASLLTAAAEEPNADLRRQMLAAGGLIDTTDGSPDA